MDITAALLNLAKLVSDHGDATNEKAIRIVADNNVRLNAKVAIVTSQLNRSRKDKAND
tara:strand:- start:245 stop:418 length:174 start_codon:yes stop_codon:yes gene_type:complete